LLFYLYLCASVVLLGAELNAAIYHLATDTKRRGQKQQETNLRRTQT